MLHYSKKWRHDAFGNVIEEINPLGEAVYRTYDKNNNLKSIRGPHPDFECRYDYDYMNRLIRIDEVE